MSQVLTFLSQIMLTAIFTKLASVTPNFNMLAQLLPATKKLNPNGQLNINEALTPSSPSSGN